MKDVFLIRNIYVHIIKNYKMKFPIDVSSKTAREKKAA